MAMYNHNQDRNFEILKRLDKMAAPKDLAREFHTTASNIRQIDHRYRRWFDKIKIKGLVRYRPFAKKTKKPTDDKSKSSQPVTHIPLTVVV